MQKVGERNNVEVKGTTATKTTAFKQLEFFDQTLAQGSLYSHCIVGSPVQVSCTIILSSSALPGAEMESILMVQARGRNTSLVGRT